jgi:O-antigen ligase
MIHGEYPSYGWSGRVHPLIAGVFLVFAFSLPFEAPLGLPVQFSTVTAMFLIGAAALQPWVTFRRPPAAFWWLAMFLWVYLARGLTSVHNGEAVVLFFHFVLVAMAFWICCNVLREERVMQLGMTAFVLGCAVVATLQVFGLASTVVDPGGEARLTAFNQDANVLGGNMALALMAILAFVYAARPRRWALWLPAGLLALLLGQSLLVSASRGALVAFALGLVAMAASSFTRRAVVANVLLIAVAIGVVAGAAWRVDPLRRRIERTVATGNMAGREEIYPEAWGLFLDKPIVGWGAMDARYELRLRTAFYEVDKERPTQFQRDAHNLALEALMGNGIVGAVPLFACIGLCALAAWRARRGCRGVAPFALIVVMLALSMSANWAMSKQAWLVFALAIASAPERGPYGV